MGMSGNYFAAGLAFLLISAVVTDVDAAFRPAPKSVNPAVRSVHAGGWFFESFDEGRDGLYKHWWFSGPWANGQPFRVGWDPYFFNINQYNVLELQLKKQQFRHPTGNYEYTAGELKSKAFYGEGCFSVCMKASGESGVSSSFYAFNGRWDSVTPRDPGSRDFNFHNEIDIEFVGKNPTQMQSNYFSRRDWRVDPNMAAGSGVEAYHDLGFDASKQFHAYSMRWASWGIQWYVGGRVVRTVYRNNDPNMPDPNFEPLRVTANVWTVDQVAEAWAGKINPNMQFTKAEYAWIKYEGGAQCNIKTHCGF